MSEIEFFHEIKRDGITSLHGIHEVLTLNSSRGISGTISMKHVGLRHKCRKFHPGYSMISKSTKMYKKYRKF